MTRSSRSVAGVLSLVAVGVVVCVGAWLVLKPVLQESPSGLRSALSPSTQSPGLVAVPSVDAPAPLAQVSEDNPAAPAAASAGEPAFATLRVILLADRWPLAIVPSPTLALEAKSDGVLLTRETKRTLGSESEILIGPLDAGDYSASVSIPGLAGIVQQVRLVRGTNELTFDLTACPGIRGRVIDEDKVPVADAEITLSPGLPGGPPLAAITTTTSADGTYAVPLLPGDLIYDLTAIATGYQPESVDLIVLDHSGPHTLEVVILHRSAVLAGTVRLEDGRAVPSCQVRTRFGTWSARTSTGENGEFSFRAVPEGEGVVWTESPTLVNSHLVLSKSSPRESVRLVVGGGAYLEGTATYDDGSPATGLLLWGFPVFAGSDPLAPRFEAYRRTASVNEPGGEFRLGPFPTGEVEVLELARTSFSGLFRTGEPARILLPRPSDWQVGLRLYKGETGLPVTTPGGYAMRWDSGGVKAVAFEPDATGYFEIAHKVPAAAILDITLSMPGYTPVLLEDIRGRSGTVIPVKLQPRPPLRIEVVESAETPVPIPNATVKVVWPYDGSDKHAEPTAADVLTESRPWFPGSGSHSLSAPTDLQGSVCFDVPAEIQLRYAVYAQDHYPVLGEIDKSHRVDEPLRVRLERVLTR